MAEISVVRLNWREWPNVAPDWERIHDRCPDASFFVSRQWVDCWLDTYGAELNPDLLAFMSDGEVAGCCLLVWRTQWVRGIPLRRVYLNCAGEDEADSTCIEYNSLLSLPGYEEQVATALARFLGRNRWDELLLPGVMDGCTLCAAANRLGSGETTVRPSYYVDFRRIRSNGKDFDSVLSVNGRRNVRVSLRAYERTWGTCTVRVPGSTEEALAMLRQLAELHQASWSERGRAGVFASPRFVRFHEELIRREFSNGRILLFEVRAGSELVGVLYGFLDRGCVRAYQSGFNYPADTHLSPGILTLYLSIRYCLDRPEITAFDFLAGDSLYKRSLGTGSRRLQWTVVRRLTIPSVIFRGLRSVKRRYVEIRRKAIRENQPPRGDRRPADVHVPDHEAGRVVSASGRE